MVEWVKDVDSGEIFPVYNVRELDIPEHLKEVEVTEVDYDKTREKTILQLQEELTEAQERIKLMKATPILKEPHEDIIIAQKTYITSEDVDFEKVPKQHDIMKIVYIILAVIAVLVIGWFMVDFINSLSNEMIFQATEVLEEIEDKLCHILKKLLPVAVTVSFVHWGVKFTIDMFRSI